MKDKGEKIKDLPPKNWFEQLFCDHEWEARTANPRACPNCKRYDWDAAKTAHPEERIVHKDIENSAMETYEAVKGLETRKEQAIAIMKSEHSSVVFAMLDKKDYKPLIWKMLRPHGRSQFKVDIDL